MTTPDPAVVHGRSFALLRHALRGDMDAVKHVAREPLGDPLHACMQIVSLTQLAALLSAHMPVQVREDLLGEAALALAQLEGQPPPGVG